MGFWSYLAVLTVCIFAYGIVDALVKGAVAAKALERRRAGDKLEDFDLLLSQKEEGKK